ncbi:unnamed protein product [Closterium sp. NIES-65]|nr:unnamed protein product [Closterium sp. NIES-65]
MDYISDNPSAVNFPGTTTRGHAAAAGGCVSPLRTASRVSPPLFAAALPLPSSFLQRMRRLIGILHLPPSLIPLLPHPRRAGPPRVSANSCARPCKVPNPPIVINVGFERDILRRATLPNDTLVTMLLWSNVRLTRGLVFGANFSCTIFNSTRPGRLTISLPNTATPVLELFNTHNVLVHGINFHISVRDSDTTICRFPNIDQVRDIYIGRYSCPAIFLFRVFAVQVTQGTVHGRIDVMRAAYSRIDNMRVTVNPANWPAAIRVSYSGHGPTLQRSNVWITNNELFSGGEGREQAQRARVGIMILWGGIGVNVMNNRLHDFTLAGIQMGHGMNNVGDAMLTKVAYNEIRHDFGETGANTRLDNSGIYFDTHWVNPGNYLRCNYVYRGGHCLYIDWVSSGVISDGLVCDQTADGLKLNSGKNNMILGMVMINTTQFSVGYISCQNNHLNNCDNYAGPNWNRLLKTYFQTPEIRWNYPYLTNFCGKNRINGIDCNNGTDAAHSRAVTSGCSGLPTENYAELVSATPSGSPKYVIYMPNCAPFPSVPALNRMRYFATSIDKAGFRDSKNGDFGLRSNSEDLCVLLFTSSRDPGIVPRNTQPPEPDGDVEAPRPSGGRRLPRTKDVVIKGKTVKVKYCDTCMLYRRNFGSAPFFPHPPPSIRELLPLQHHTKFSSRIPSPATPSSCARQAAAVFALQHLQQLRGEIRPPLPLGGPVHRQAQLPILLSLRVLHHGALHLCLLTLRLPHQGTSRCHPSCCSLLPLLLLISAPLLLIAAHLLLIAAHLLLIAAHLLLIAALLLLTAAPPSAQNSLCPSFLLLLPFHHSTNPLRSNHSHPPHPLPSPRNPRSCPCLRQVLMDNAYEPGGETRTVWQALGQAPMAAVLMAYTFLAVWFVGGLSAFHLYLMSTNQTTYENFRYRYDKKRNPNNRGIMRNVYEALCSPIPPSRNHFRADLPDPSAPQPPTAPSDPQQPELSAAIPPARRHSKGSRPGSRGSSGGRSPAQRGGKSPAQREYDLVEVTKLREDEGGQLADQIVEAGGVMPSGAGVARSGSRDGSGRESGGSGRKGGKKKSHSGKLREKGEGRKGKHRDRGEGDGAGEGVEGAVGVGDVVGGGGGGMGGQVAVDLQGQEYVQRRYSPVPDVPRDGL